MIPVKKPTILLVEDEALIALEEVQTLSRFGYNVVSASSGIKAVDLIANKPDIDLVLMDIDLGHGIDGTEAARRILSFRTIPIVFLTSHSEREMVEKVRGITRYGYVIKNSGDFVLQSSIEMAFELFEAHQTMADSERKYSAAFRTSPDAVNINALDGTYVDINEGFTRLTGFTREEVVGVLSSAIDIWAVPEDRKTLIAGLENFGEVNNLESTFRCKDGTLKTCLISARIIALRGKPHILSITRDISERKQTEDRLRKSEAKQSAMIANIADVIAVVDRQGIKRFISPNVSKWFGWDPEELVGAGAWTNIHPDDLATMEVFFRSLLGKPDFTDTTECRYRCKDGTYSWIEMAAVNRLDDPEISGVLVNYHDITERKQLEMALDKRLVALTRPIDEPEKVTFEELFDLSTLQSIQDEFSAATGVASIITRIDGTPITAPSNFCRLCKDIIRCTETGLANCFHSDAVIGRHHANGPIIQPCLSGGLWDAGASITVGDRHIANWLIGQVRDETQNDETIREYARAIGAEEQEAVKAFREVPAMPIERFSKIARALYTLANQLSTMAYQNVQQARFIFERKRVEEQLRASEEKYRMLTENIADLMWELDSSYCFTYVNPADEHLRGFSSREVIGTPLWSALKPEGVEHLRRMSEQRLREEQNGISTGTNRYEIEVKCKDGSWVWMELNLTAAHDRNRKLTGFRCVARNISERKKVEESIFRQMEQHKAILHTAMDGYCLIDLEGHILEVSDMYCRMSGYSEQELLTMAISDLDANETAVETSKHINNIMERGSDRFESTHRRKDGTTFDVEVNAQFRKDDGGRIVSFFRDITARKRSEEQIHMLKHSIDILPDGAYWMDRDNRFVYVNESGYNSLGYTRDEMALLDLSTVNPRATPEMMQMVWDRLELEGSMVTESVHRRKDGTVFPVEITSTLVRHKDKEYNVGFARDITTRKQAEDLLRRSEERYRNLFANTEAIMLIIDPETTVIVDANPAALSYYGLNRDDLNSITLADVNSRTLQENIDITSSVLHGEANHFFRKHRRADGAVRDVEVYTSPISFGDTTKLFSIIHDVTERREIEQALHRSEEMYRMLINTMDAGVFESTFDGRFTTLNRAVVEMAGYDSPEELKSTSAACLYAEAKDRESVVESLRRDGFVKNLELRSLKKNGTQYWISLNATIRKNSLGQPESILGVVTDISERKRIEQDQSDALEYLDTLLENCPIGILTFRANGDLVSANRASELILGGPVEQLPIRNFNEIKSWKTSGLLDSVLVSLQSNKESETEVEITTIFGKHVSLSVRVAPFRYQSTKHVIVLFADISDRKAADLHIEELLSQRELLLKEVHHRIKNNMITMSSLLSMQASAMKDQAAVTALRESQGRLRSMMTLYDKLYRTDNYREISTDEYLSALVDEIIENIPFDGPIEIRRHFDDFSLDVKRMMPLGILVNELLSNIMKHAFRAQEGGLITVSATKDNERVSIVIQDNGVGIPESLDVANSSSFGLRLINALAIQLNATLRLERGAGTRWVLDFAL
jgi:PAS domain S-box-containing protein